MLIFENFMELNCCARRKKPATSTPLYNTRAHAPHTNTKMPYPIVVNVCRRQSTHTFSHSKTYYNLKRTIKRNILRRTVAPNKSNEAYERSNEELRTYNEPANCCRSPSWTGFTHTQTYHFVYSTYILSIPIIYFFLSIGWTTCSCN